MRLMTSALESWVALAPQAWPLQTDQTWHTYVSYRADQRSWVLQLYDILKALGYEVFLDQYVLTAGGNMALALQQGLEQSGSQIIVWGASAAHSEWMRREYESAMKLKRDNPDFRSVLVLLDNSPLPGFAFESIYINFSEFREGPNGTPLLQLLYGLQGKPLPPEAVELSAKVDAETHEATALIRAARAVGQPEMLTELARSQTLAWLTTPSLLCQVIDA